MTPAQRDGMRQHVAAVRRAGKARVAVSVHEVERLLGAADALARAHRGLDLHGEGCTTHLLSDSPVHAAVHERCTCGLAELVLSLAAVDPSSHCCDCGGDGWGRESSLGTHACGRCSGSGGHGARRPAPRAAKHAHPCRYLGCVAVIEVHDGGAAACRCGALACSRHVGR